MRDEHCATCYELFIFIFFVCYYSHNIGFAPLQSITMATEIYPSETTDPFTQPSLPISTIDNAVIYLSIVKIVIGIIGITGNLMVLAVLKFQSQRGQFLICSQAVIDMLTSILFVADAFTSLYPPSVPQDPIFGYLYCLIWNFGAIVFVFFALIYL